MSLPIRIRVLLLLAVGWSIGSALVAAEPATAKAPADRLELREVYFWEDGGSYGVDMIDAAGQPLRFSVDHRFDSEHRGRFFEGAIHPQKPGTRMLPEGDPREAELLGLLQTWLDRRFTLEGQRELRATKLEDRSRDDDLAFQALGVLEARRQELAQRRWLKANYDVETMERLAGLKSDDGLDVRDRSAWKILRKMPVPR